MTAPSITVKVVFSLQAGCVTQPLYSLTEIDEKVIFTRKIIQTEVLQDVL